MAKNYCSVINCQLHGRSTSQFHMWFWSVIFINFFNKNKVNKQHKKNNSFSTTHHFLQRKGQITNMLLAWSKGWPLQSQGLRPCLYLGARGGWQTTHTHTLFIHYMVITYWYEEVNMPGINNRTTIPWHAQKRHHVPVVTVQQSRDMLPKLRNTSVLVFSPSSWCTV